jgi:DNA-binding FrmR family transcriptional regulator
MVQTGASCGEVVRQIRAVDGSLEAVLRLMIQREARQALRARSADEAESHIRFLLRTVQRDAPSCRVLPIVSGKPSRGT